MIKTHWILQHSKLLRRSWTEQIVPTSDVIVGAADNKLTNQRVWNSSAVTCLTEPLSKDKRLYQLHRVFRPELLHHGVKLSAPRLRCCVALLGRGGRRGSRLVLRIVLVAFFQQVDGSLHDGKALPSRGAKTQDLWVTDGAQNQQLLDVWRELTSSEVSLFSGSFRPAEKMEHSSQGGERISVNDILLFFAF